MSIEYNEVTYVLLMMPLQVVFGTIEIMCLFTALLIVGLNFFSVINILTSVSSTYLQACVLYTLRVGVTDQMTESTQRSFLVFLGKQVC